MNIMNEYLKITEKYITKYFKVILENRFNKKISDEFIKTYIEARYYDMEESQSRNELKSNILKKIYKKAELLLNEFPKQEVIIEQIKNFYKYILYFDNVIHKKDTEKLINDIYEKKKQITNKVNEDFEQTLRNIVSEYKASIQDLLTKLESGEFSLEIKKISDENRLEEIVLNHDIKFPMIYSNEAIQKAFETDIIKEDMQAVEYYLVIYKILKNIINGDMKKQYIVSFQATIFDKKQKLKRIIEIINNQFIQEKITIKVKYMDFIKYKKEYSNLIRNGFKIAVLIDEGFDISKLKELEISKYVLINKDLKIYPEIIKSKHSLNIIGM